MQFLTVSSSTLSSAPLSRHRFCCWVTLSAGLDSELDMPTPAPPVPVPVPPTELKKEKCSDQSISRASGSGVAGISTASLPDGCGTGLICTSPTAPPPTSAAVVPSIPLNQTRNLRRGNQSAPPR
jgi:hypothetical protein